MKYFGTDLRQAGHYLWELDNTTMRNLGIPNYGSKGEKLPFDPEGLGRKLENGQILFAQTKNYTILVIGGSCTDTRPGSKSVFFVEELCNKEDIIEKIQNIPIAVKILDSMEIKFKIQWI